MMTEELQNPNPLVFSKKDLVKDYYQRRQNELDENIEDLLDNYESIFLKA